jgi:hypothetical protein
MASQPSDQKPKKRPTFSVVALALAALVVVGLLSVGGVALYGKLKGLPLPTLPPISTRPPTSTAVSEVQTPVTPILIYTPTPQAAPTQVPPTQVPATQAPTAPVVQPTATSLPTAEATAAPTTESTAQPVGSPEVTQPPSTSTTVEPTATSGASGEMPNTGGPVWQMVLAAGSLVAVVVLARTGRRKTA